MIKSFYCKETEKIWKGEISKKLPFNIQDVARRKLRMIHNSSTLSELNTPPGNRLEPLQGERIGEYSIRINDQWRICFIWHQGNIYNVHIIDYH